MIRSVGCSGRRTAITLLRPGREAASHRATATCGAVRVVARHVRVELAGRGRVAN